MILKNRLAYLMLDRGIKSVSDLHRRIQDSGLTISRRTLDKFYSNESNRFDADTLSTLCSILDCDIGDMLYFERERSEQEYKQMIGRGTRLEEEN